jgi:hypothetical protein
MAKKIRFLIEAHIDGSYSSIPDPTGTAIDEVTKKHHPTLGHLVAHLANEHALGDHFYIQGHEDGFATFAVLDGNVHGPNEHEHVSDVACEMTRFMNGDCDLASTTVIEREVAR